MFHFNKIRFVLTLLLATAALGAGARDHLLYTHQLVDMARDNIKTDSSYASAWRFLRDDAQRGIERTDLNRMESMALAYVMTDSAKYADGIIRTLKKLDVVKSWGDSEMMGRRPQWRSDLGVAHKSYLCAVGYDAVRDLLKPSERISIAKNLYRLGLEPSLGDWVLNPSRIHSLNSMGHNWWTSCAGMGGILALALRDDLPEAREGAIAVREAIPQWFGFAGDGIQNKMKTFDDEVGGMYESFGYSCFGISEALQFLTAWNNSGLPQPSTPRELEEGMEKQLRLLPGFFCQASYPRTGYIYSINFGDGHKNTAGELAMSLLWNLGVKDGNILWYLSQVEEGQHRDSKGLKSPLGILYIPAKTEKTRVRTLPNECLWKTFGWATIRDSWDKDATMLAVKSGHTWNHAHADANSFILYHKGEDIIRDGGNCYYPNPPYREYFFQSQAHNIVTFNGEAQPRLQQYQGSMTDGHLSGIMSLGGMRYIMGDATGPTGKNFARNLRHFLWLDDVLFVIDDLEAYDKGTFEWLWHPNGDVKIKGGEMTVTNNKSQVVVRPLFPQSLVPSGFVHDYPDFLYVKEYEVPTEDLKGTDKYYGFCLPDKESRVKGVTAVILKDSVGWQALPEIEKRDGKNWIGVRIKRGDSITDLYINQLADGRLMHLNSWIYPDGWETDAYMFAVMYPANAKPTPDNSSLFVNYGSALRRDSKTWFASQSKLDVMTDNVGGKTSMRIDGQPHGIAYFGMKKPGRLDLPMKHTSSYSDGNLKIIF